MSLIVVGKFEYVYGQVVRLPQAQDDEPEPQQEQQRQEHRHPQPPHAAEGQDAVGGPGLAVTGWVPNFPRQNNQAD